MDDFERQLAECRGAVERFVYYKMPNKYDADDVLQETYLSAHLKYSELKDKSCFKPWILSIARNKCTDYFRKKANEFAIPIDDLTERQLVYGRGGRSEIPAVRDTLDVLKDRDRQILYLCFFQNMPQADIAKKLNIPLGTVKSRLHAAKAHFKEKYPYSPKAKGDVTMKKFPEYLEYTIEKTDGEAFPVKFEALPNWFIIPRDGEQVRLRCYDKQPGRRDSWGWVSTVVGKVKLHGVTGVEIKNVPVDHMGDEICFVAQLTDTHVRWLAMHSRGSDNVWRCLTFLDGDEFMDVFGFGENNCGFETDLRANGIITLSDNGIEVPENRRCRDVVGRYNVSICGKEYDTICVIDFKPNVYVKKVYIDRDGRTVLSRHFSYEEDSSDTDGYEIIMVNGEKYANYIDSISDRIL